MSITPVSTFITEGQTGETIFRYKVQRGGSIKGLEVLCENHPQRAKARLEIKRETSSNIIEQKLENGRARFPTVDVMGQSKLYLSMYGEEGDVSPFGGIWISFLYKSSYKN